MVGCLVGIGMVGAFIIGTLCSFEGIVFVCAAIYFGFLIFYKNGKPSS